MWFGMVHIKGLGRHEEQEGSFVTAINWDLSVTLALRVYKRLRLKLESFKGQ